MAWGRVVVCFVAVVPLVVACGGSTRGTRTDDEVPRASKTGQACPGVEDAEGGHVRCRSSDECSGNDTCQSYLPYPCSNGINSCYQDSECGVGHLCLASGQYSCVGFGSINICGAPCTESSCADGSSCEADGRCGPTSCHSGYECPSDLVCAQEGDMPMDEHGCRPARCESDEYTCGAGLQCSPTDRVADKNGCVAVSCVAGFECPANQRCAPDSPALHTHQCERLACDRDSDCDCGYCIEGTCHDALSYCAPPPIG